MSRADTPEALMELVLTATGDRKLAVTKAAELMEAIAIQQSGRSR